MTTLTEKIIEVLPKEKETEMCESPCDSCLSAEGFNSCRSEVIAAIPKILEIVKYEIDNLPRYGTCEQTGNKWAILEEDIELLLK